MIVLALIAAAAVAAPVTPAQGRPAAPAPARASAPTAARKPVVARQPALLPPTPAILIPLVNAVERIPLPRTKGPVDLRVDPLAAQLSLGAPRDLGILAARVAAGLGHICPKWEVADGRVVLSCRSRRLQAAIVEDGPRRFLDIHELRGLPWQGADQRLELFYDPVKVKMGGPCPGRTPAARGECALRDGQLTEATLQFKLAQSTHDRTFALLRLGDMAARRQDYPEAAALWSRAGSGGPFGRLAVTRLCELRGDCIDVGADNVFEAGEIVEPVRTELLLRGARVEAFAGRSANVVRRISELLDRPASGGCVTVGEAFCRRLLLATLQDKAAADGGRAALEVYLRLPARATGPYDVDMARAASSRAAEIGAPIFAANLLASVAASVPSGETPQHLLRTAELYLKGDDYPRAQLVLDYAESRLAPQQMSGARWGVVQRNIAAATEDHTGGDRRGRMAREILTAEATRDLANALTALAQLRQELE